MEGNLGTIDIVSPPFVGLTQAKLVGQMADCVWCDNVIVSFCGAVVVLASVYLYIAMAS